MSTFYGLPKSFVLILTLVFFLLGPRALFSAHLVGGEITYDCLGIDVINGVEYATFAFTAKMYRDCQGGGAQFDDPGDFYLFRGSGDDWEFVEFKNAGIDIESDLPLTDDPCIEPPSNVCLDEGTYEFEFQFPVSNDESYMVVYQRCCRNNTIVNIVMPEEAGVSFTVSISPLAQQICNNSPKFNELPPPIICGNKDLVFDHSATDPDGHTLVYEFCAPLDGGGTNGLFGNPGNVWDCEGINPDVSLCPPPYDDLVFKLPTFSATNPLGTAANLQINSNTGMMTGSPMDLGQYVVGVCISEYLNGELLGVIQRDFQFNVTECIINVSAAIEDAEVIVGKNLKLEHCGDDPLEIINQSIDEATIEGYLWRFFISPSDVLEYDTRDVSVPFPEPGFYTGLMVVNPESNGCSDTLFLEIDVFPDMKADFVLDYDTCVAEKVKFEDASESETGVILTWDWEFDDGDFSNIQDPNYLYETPGTKTVTLTTSDLNGCSNEIEKEFDYYPAPPVVVVEPNAFAGCSPANIIFNNLSTPIDTSYDVMWDFGDGTFGTNVNEVHDYDEVGVYSVAIEITSPLDCQVSREYPFWIEVLPAPVADFSFTPEQPEGNDVVVQFTNESTDAISWQYIFDNESTVYQPNPNYVFDTIGEHVIELIALHPSGCPDTIVKSLLIRPTSSFFIPNAFSPNGDGVNDLFRGKGNVELIEDFYIEIYARSGERVYNSDEITLGWNGRIDNEGRELPPDVYVYKYSYKDADKVRIEEQGVITLVR